MKRQGAKLPIHRLRQALCFILLFIGASWLLFVFVPRSTGREHIDLSWAMETSARAVFNAYVRESEEADTLTDPMRNLSKWQRLCRQNGLELVSIELLVRNIRSLGEVELRAPVLRLYFLDGTWATVGFGHFASGP